jgi:hypothetical protein
MPFLQALRTIAIKPHIWTVGDPEWQRTKFAKTGAFDFVDNDHYHCVEANKDERLRELLNELSKHTNQFIVVDDKQANIKKIRQITKEFMDKGIVIGDYHMKLYDPQADATAFFQWLQSLGLSPGSFELILDFDGVVADTDNVLFGPAVENLTRLLISR